LTTESEPELTETQKAYNVAQSNIFQLAAYGHCTYTPRAELLTDKGKAEQADYNDRIRKAREELEAAVLRLVAEHAETFRGDWGVPAAWLRSLAEDPAELSLLAVRPDERETDTAPAAHVAAPPTGQAGLREQIAEALMAWAERNNNPQYARARRSETVTANAYSRADSVMVVLRGLTLRELEQLYRPNTTPSRPDPYRTAAEAHRLALSTALGLGTSAPWDAIRERAAELAGQPVAVGRGADADRRLYAWAHDIDTDDGDVCIPGVRSSGTGPEEIAIVVHREDMPVLAGMLAEAGDAPVDRGAVLREAADELDAHAAQLVDTSDDPAVFVAKARARAAIEWRVAAALLRRLAEDATPVAPSAATPNGTGAAVAASGDRPAVLTEPERQFLTLALDLAADQMASRGDEFGDEDTAALDTLRHLAAETPTAPPGCWYNAEAAEESMDAESMAAETPGPETQGRDALMAAHAALAAHAGRQQAALARIGQMADYWEQKLPEVIRTPAVVSALRAALEPTS
jgi:hypothetical protein